MSKQTSIEWLIDQMFKQGYFDGNTPLSITNLDHLQYQAKQMHKEEIVSAYCIGKFINVDDRQFGEQYYNETYGGNNESCEHISYRAGHSPFVPSICNDCGEEL